MHARLVASGCRYIASDKFKTAHSHASDSDCVAFLIDSWGRVSDIEETRGHLRWSDGWLRPQSARND